MDDLPHSAMHRRDAATDVLTQAILRYAVDRTRLDPPPLDHPRTEDELRATCGRTVTDEGEWLPTVCRML